ncbi:RNA-directed DNA polymerase [Pluralibacter gergoviae]
MLVREHYLETKDLLADIEPKEIGRWLLNNGYFPEEYVLPPCFKAEKFKLKRKPFFEDFKSINSSHLINVSYPKTSLTHRVFGIQHPKHYHDMVYWLIKDWDLVVEHLFNADTRIYTYSLPIPVTKTDAIDLSPIRSGRMIYEWIEMAERDLIADAVKYNYLVRTDITNFYASIYTHSIAWALHGKQDARKDNESELLGNKLDKLLQYSNDRKTNGISIGSALSDLIAEIILSKVDKNVSLNLPDVDFVGVRFKDDYRILCNDESDAKKILKAIADELLQYNLNVNESKTKVTKLPNGLYREHSKNYYPYSLAGRDSFSFRDFEQAALKAIDIHNAYPGTSILNKFLSELTKKEKLLVTFSKSKAKKFKEIKKLISLLFMIKRESEKVMSAVLSIVDIIFLEYRKTFPELKVFIKDIIVGDIKRSSENDSVFDVLWLVFFAKFRSLGIGDTGKLIDSDFIKRNDFYKCAVQGKKIFKDEDYPLFTSPKNLKESLLITYVDLFRRD